MIGLAALLAAQAAAVESPRTVNGSELGKPEDFATPGPARVCIRGMVVTPREGETAYLAYSGIHNAGVRLVLADGDYADFTLSESFLDLRRPDQGPAIRTQAMRAYRVEDGREVFYQVHGLVEQDDGEGAWRPLVRVDGSGIGSSRLDREILSRLSFDRTRDAHCDREYQFGWGVILDGDAIDVTDTQ